jgi:tuftelin-interacting protein 11
MIGSHHYAVMLDQQFFPKWLQVLSTWLANSPNFDEVTKW